MSTTSQAEDVSTQDRLKIPEISLVELESLSTSVLGEALRRVQRSSTESGPHITAHNSTRHNSSHYSTVW